MRLEKWENRLTHFPIFEKPVYKALTIESIEAWKTIIQNVFFLIHEKCSQVRSGTEKSPKKRTHPKCSKMVIQVYFVLQPGRVATLVEDSEVSCELC